MPAAEIITIGTELLLGEIVDTNTQLIVQELREVGLDVYRTMTVGDNCTRIAAAIEEGLTRADLVITTGGLGPTVDDQTRKAAAQAAGVALEFREDLWSGIKSKMGRLGREVTDNNQRQAYLPQGAIPLANDRGTAPAFILEANGGVIVCLPGVPPEMKPILVEKVIPWLRSHFSLSEIILSKSVITVGIGESKVDQLITDLEHLENPTVGLSAHKGSVEVRITVKAESEEEAAREIAKVEGKLRKRLSPWIQED